MPMIKESGCSNVCEYTKMIVLFASRIANAGQNAYLSRVRCGPELIRCNSFSLFSYLKEAVPVLRN